MSKGAIIGAGLIGYTWAIVLARAGHSVSLFDTDSAVLSGVGRLITKALADLDVNGLLDETPDAIASRITPSRDLKRTVEKAEFVQECIPEQLQLKREIFSLLDAHAESNAVLASSSSTIPASKFTEELPGRDRCIILHPSTPPHILPLVEISPTPWTSQRTIDRTIEFVKSIGQIPSLIRREIDGFVLNRLQAAIVCEAFRLWEDGYASAEDIEATVRETLGKRWALMGPFETISLNAPNGLVDYLEKFGDLFYRINATQLARPFNMDAVKRLEAERLAGGLNPDIQKRRSLRDQRLLALAAHNKATG